MNLQLVAKDTSTDSTKINHPEHTLRSLINVQSGINVQGDKFSKKNKRTGRKSSSISVKG